MKKNMLKNLAVLTAASATIVMMSSAAFAQEKVCVNLLVKAGYAAYIEAKVGNLPATSSSKSTSFAIGQKKCITIKDLIPPDVTVNQGTPITVILHPYGGRKAGIECTPSKIAYDANRTDSLIYNAWGTTLSPKCTQ